VSEFVAIYSGDTVATARIVALSDDPSLVGEVARRIVAQRTPEAAQYLGQNGHGGNGSGPRKNGARSTQH
jgi:hypothetical protein